MASKFHDILQMKLIWIVDLLILVAVAYYLLLAPFTKVEESFNIQAIHDILNFGISSEALESFDHREFSGVVPRTFVGALVLSGIVKAIDYVWIVASGSSFVSDASNGEFHVQLIVRAVLGLANVLGLISMRNSINKVAFTAKNSRRGVIGFWFSILLLTQFHLLYYSTRTLPNFVALPAVTYALSKLIAGDMSGLTWMGFLGVVFRLEIGLFGSIIAVVSSLGFGQSGLKVNLFFLTVGSVVGLLLSASVDSFFWGKLLVPELEAFKFNVLEGHSAQWGVEPYKAYFTKYAFNLFRPPHVILLALLSLLTDPAHDGTPVKFTEDNRMIVSHPARNSLRVLTIASILFVAVMSLQPHKEWRFVVYVVPVLTMLAASGLTTLSRKWSRLIAHKLWLLVVLLSIGISLIISLIMSYASSYNYPGGDAITFLNGYINKDVPATVHMDVAACMSGITKFTELHDPLITFDKTENPVALVQAWNKFDYLITEVDMEKDTLMEIVPYNSENWVKLQTVTTFKDVNVWPLILLGLRAYQEKTAIFGIWWDEIKKANVPSTRKFFKSLIFTSDYLYVYKRTGNDLITGDPLALEAAEEVNVEEVVPEVDPLPEVESDLIEDAINEEINHYEEVYENEVDPSLKDIIE